MPRLVVRRGLPGPGAGPMRRRRAGGASAGRSRYLLCRTLRAPRVTRPASWGAQTRSSRRGFVFVEQSAEKVAPSDLRRVKGRCGRRIGSAAAIRRLQVERAVWTLLVEVADVDAEDVLELATTEDQQPVEALPAHAADPAFGVGVRVRRQNRRPNDLDAFAPEDLVEDA